MPYSQIMEYSYCEAWFSLQKKPNINICNSTYGFLKHRKEQSIIKLFHMVNSGSSKYQLTMTQFFVLMRLTSGNMSSELIERERKKKRKRKAMWVPPILFILYFKHSYIFHLNFYLTLWPKVSFFLMNIMIFEIWNGECLEIEYKLSSDKMKKSTYNHFSFCKCKLHNRNILLSGCYMNFK